MDLSACMLHLKHLENPYFISIPTCLHENLIDIPTYSLQLRHVENGYIMNIGHVYRTRKMEYIIIYRIRKLKVQIEFLTIVSVIGCRINI